MLSNIVNIVKMGIKKDGTLPPEARDKFLQLIFNTADLGECAKRVFTKEQLEKKVQDYLDTNMGDELRRYIMVKECRKLSRTIEEKLSVGDLICILRYILKVNGYRLRGTTENNYQGWIYWIKKDN